MPINRIIVLVIVLSFECCGPPKSEISNATKTVEDAKRYMNSDEAKNISDRIANEKVLSDQLAIIIDESQSALLIHSKNEIIEISTNLINLTEEIIVTIEETHGKDQNGEILNKSESKYVNQVMLDKKMATQLKLAINKNIESSMKIFSENQINITKEELPLSLNLFMETNDITWEEYIFQNMPFGAVMPVLLKYKNDVQLNKLFVLEELSKKVKK